MKKEREQMPVEYALFIAAITAISTFIGVSLNLRNFRRTQRQDDQTESAASARIEMGVHHLQTGVSCIQHDLSDIKREIKDQHERIVRVEEVAKSAHRRLDEIVQRR